MTKEDKNLLTSWLRGIEIHDEDEDGGGEFTLRFKIRDDPKKMARIYNAMSRDDAFGIAEEYIRLLCPGCEYFEKDWIDQDSGFNLSFELDDDGFITIKGNYRT